MYQVKEIKDFPDYEVSNTGDVISYKSGTPVVLKGGYGSNGYRQVELRNGKTKKKALVHRLVAEAFVPGEGETVDHIDRDKDNNCAENLRWMSLLGNIRRRNKSGLPPGVITRGRGYQARRRVNGDYRHSPTVHTMQEAVDWYNAQV